MVCILGKNISFSRTNKFYGELSNININQFQRDRNKTCFHDQSERAIKGQ